MLGAIFRPHGNAQHHGHLKHARRHRLPFRQLIEHLVPGASDEVAVHELDQHVSAAHSAADRRADSVRGAACHTSACLRKGRRSGDAERERHQSDSDDGADAVFHHVQQLPQIIDELFEGFSGTLSAIGVSSKPRDAEGSYMPCFTVGYGTAKALSSALNVPLYTFSHQNGHIAAAVYSAGCTELLGQRFLAFHVSGGTTEAVIVEPDKENVFKNELAAKTLDLNAGQLIDRVGVMLGLSFPCGCGIERQNKTIHICALSVIC